MSTTVTKKPLNITHPILAEEWVYAVKRDKITIDESKTPQTVTRGSTYRVLWRKECKPGVFHEWVAKIHSRGVRGTGCPRCKRSNMEKYMQIVLEKNKDELNISEFFGNFYVNNEQKEWCYADFYLQLKNGECVVIELDGLQHFVPSSFKKHSTQAEQTETLDNNRERDRKKNQLFESKNFHLLRIDFATQLQEYKEVLKNFINGIKKNCKWTVVNHGIWYSK